jgi:F-type H+-transporting ATPase subunit b
MTEHVEHPAATAHHGAAHGPTVGQLFWPALNFVLFVVLLVRFLRGPIVVYFRERGARLRDALAAGARAREAAETLRAQLARDMENLPALRERLRADLRAAAERERDNLVAQGRTAAARIRRDAELLAEQEFAAARDAVRAEVIEEAIRQATVLVQEGIRPQDQERFVRDFVTNAGMAAA